MDIYDFTSMANQVGEVAFLIDFLIIIHIKHISPQKKYTNIRRCPPSCIMGTSTILRASFPDPLGVGVRHISTSISGGGNLRLYLFSPSILFGAREYPLFGGDVFWRCPMGRISRNRPLSPAPPGGFLGPRGRCRYLVLRRRKISLS